MLTEEQIKEINNTQESSEMGIYCQPYKIPTSIKGLVLYQRFNTGGYCGGNCWNNDEPRRYHQDEIPEFTILDDVLDVLCPVLTIGQYKEIKKLIKTSEYTDRQYYGNSDDYRIRYLVLDDLYKEIEKITTKFKKLK